MRSAEMTVEELLHQLPPGSTLVGFWLGVAWTRPDGTVVQSRSPVIEIPVLLGRNEDADG